MYAVLKLFPELSSSSNKSAGSGLMMVASNYTPDLSISRMSLPQPRTRVAYCDFTRIIRQHAGRTLRFIQSQSTSKPLECRLHMGWDAFRRLQKALALKALMQSPRIRRSRWHCAVPRSMRRRGSKWAQTLSGFASPTSARPLQG